MDSPLANKALAKVFKLITQLLELHGENKFKTRSYSNAAFKIERLEQQLAEMPHEEISKIDGIGKSVYAKIIELLETGELTYLNDLLGKTPAGVVEMLGIKGIGPSKIGPIWRDLGIESLGELLYACNENRLVDLKGFGAKTQEQIKKAVRYKLDNAGNYHFAVLDQPSIELVEAVRAHLNTELVELTGAVRRKDEILDRVEILVGHSGDIPENLLEISPPAKVDVLRCAPEQFAHAWFKSTAGEDHLKPFKLEGLEQVESETEIYRANNFPFVVPEMRNGDLAFEWAKKHQTDALVKDEDLKGILHNHSTWSDGQHSLKEMATYCRDLGFEYLGICDHSKSAFYANGLSVERVAQQHEEIDSLNAELAPFKIFKGIESDILNDGSLDYDNDVLASFDFIVSSVHSNLKMDLEKATSRLITAVENPYTTILGHPTSRLLLSREGYPIDHKKVIDACAANGVVLELNANPFRLDVDWRWIPYAMEKGVQISINPDAHSKEGYHHMHFGVCAARKGGLIGKECFNALTASEIALFFQNKKP